MNVDEGRGDSEDEDRLEAMYADNEEEIISALEAKNNARKEKKKSRRRRKASCGSGTKVRKSGVSLNQNEDC